MSGTGRSLQDIYDAGSKRLDELEQTQKQALELAGGQSVEELSSIESSVMQRMEKSLQDLEGEVRNYLDKALEGVKAAATTEVEENKRFLERLQEALKLTSNSLSEDVKHLKESLTARANSSIENNLLLQQRFLEQATGILKADGALSAAQLKEQSQSCLAEFEVENSHLVMTVLDKNINLPAAFFAEFAKNIANVERRMNECMQALGSRGAEICADLSNDTTEIQASLDTSLQHIQGTLDEAFIASDAKLSAQCEHALAEALAHQESMAQQLASEIQNSPQLSGSSVTDKLNNLRTDTDKLLEQVRQLITDVDFGVRSNSSKLSEEFEESLQTRMENAREHHKLVGEERAQLMERIGGDLREIESGFQTRLSELAQKCLGRLSTVCVDAELAIVSAHDNCAAEFKNVSSAQERAIEEKTQAILSEIESLSANAILAIKMAAGEGGNPIDEAARAQASAAELGLLEGFGDDPFGDLKL